MQPSPQTSEPTAPKTNLKEDMTTQSKSIQDNGRNGNFFPGNPNFEITESPKKKSSFFNDPAAFRDRFFYRFYTKYLKRYATVHRLVLWLWRNIKFLQTKLLFTWRTLIKLSDFARKKKNQKFILADETVVETPIPQPSEPTAPKTNLKEDMTTQSESIQDNGSNDIFFPGNLNFKIIRIENSKKKSSFFNDPTAFRDRFFYRFYTKYLKRYATVHRLVLWLWRNMKFIQAKLLFTKIVSPSKSFALRWRALIKLSDFAQKKKNQKYILADETVVETPIPQVFPSRDQNYIASPHARYNFPEIFITIIDNAMIYGGSNLVLVNNAVVYHDLYDFQRDYTSEELHGRTFVNANRRRIRMMSYDNAPERIPVAAPFVDACAPNYAHWLTEVLPRVALFCKDERFKNIPIVVNDGLHKNIMEGLFWVTDPEREIYLLPMGRALRCDMLYLTSATGYVPFDWRSKKTSDCSHGKFSPLAFQVLYNHFKNLAKNIENQTWPKKIFLRRNSEYRKVVNSQEVENFFLSNDYMVIEPEKLSFLQQVALFQNAKVIVGASGAALANLIFAPPDSNIFIFISKHPDTIYWYWQNIARASGKTVTYVLGEIRDSNLLGIHSSFSVDLDGLAALVSAMELQ